MSDRGHCSDEAIEQYSLGRLSAAEAEKFEEHLLICPACQERLEREDEFTRSMRAALEQPAAPPRHVRRWRWPVMAAAAAAFVVLLTVWMRQPPAPVEAVLMAQRSETAASVPADVPLRLTLVAATNSATARAEIVSTAGERLWSGPATGIRPRHFVVEVPRLRKGNAFARLYLSDVPELAQEYALTVQ